MSGVFGYLLLGEKMTMVHFISGAAIIGGVMWCLIPSRQIGLSKSKAALEAGGNA